jgi:aspartate/glutamate racemase
MRPAAPPALAAARALEAPVWRFERHQAAVRAMGNYQAALCDRAARRRASGLTVTDQDQPEEVFCLDPARPEQPPLAIVGGMGPQSGALAFRQACARFRDSRAVVLYQACSVPDRSTVILGEGRPDTPRCQALASRLVRAVRLAVELAPPARQPVRCLIACNSAHYFWPLVVEGLRRAAWRPPEVRMISLVEASLAALGRSAGGRTLLLATEGARVGQVFSAPCREAGVPFDEPSPALSRQLMRAIYEGVKSLDERRAVELGNACFEAVLRSGEAYDRILAGCTELALLVDLLRGRGSPAVVAFLSRVEVIDPMQEALGHA